MENFWWQDRCLRKNLALGGKTQISLAYKEKPRKTEVEVSGVGIQTLAVDTRTAVWYPPLRIFQNRSGRNSETFSDILGVVWAPALYKIPVVVPFLVSLDFFFFLCEDFFFLSLSSLLSKDFRGTARIGREEKAWDSADQPEGPRRAPGRKCRKSAPRSAFGDPAGSAGKSAEKLPKKCAPPPFLAFRERFRQFFGTFSGTPMQPGPQKHFGEHFFGTFGPELFGAPLAGRRNLKKRPHPHTFSFTKKTARFTKGRFRPSFLLMKDPKGPYEGQFCGKTDREGSCSKAARGPS